MQQTSWVVVPLMLVELVRALWMVRALPDARYLWPWWNLALRAVIWASTFLLQVLQHRRLVGRFERRAHRRLVYTNWVGTFAWSLWGATGPLEAGANSHLIELLNRDRR